jgi:hypothetical protein
MADTKTRATVAGEGGLHRDGAKPRLADMVHWDSLLEAGRIWAQNNQPNDDYPEGKYPDIDGRPNFHGGIQTTKLLDSAQRHLIELMCGNDIDGESGYDHVGHLLCCAFMFAWTREHRPDLDNR